MNGTASVATRQFAEGRGLRHFLHPRYSGDAWRAPVQRAIGDGTVDLHVNTTGFNAGFREMAMRGKSTGARATEEEMYWIARAVANGRREWSSVRFYDENGNILNIPEPDWSTFGRLHDFYF